MFNVQISQKHLAIVGSIALAASAILATDQVAQYGWAACTLLVGARLVWPITRQLLAEKPADMDSIPEVMETIVSIDGEALNHQGAQVQEGGAV